MKLKQTYLITMYLEFLGDGFIDFNEYVDMMKQNYVTIDIERERMKAAFAMLDFDGDGYISKEELVKSLVTKQSGITEADIDDILRDADMDGNDQIDFNGINYIRYLREEHFFPAFLLNSKSYICRM